MSEMDSPDLPRLTDSQVVALLRSEAGKYCGVGISEALSLAADLIEAAPVERLAPEGYAPISFACQGPPELRKPCRGMWRTIEGDLWCCGQAAQANTTRAEPGK